LPFAAGPAVEDPEEGKKKKEKKKQKKKKQHGAPNLLGILVLIVVGAVLLGRLGFLPAVYAAELAQTTSLGDTVSVSPACFIAFDHITIMATKSVPRPGPANLGPNSGLDEWLEEAKQCHYLPESVMKELCEKVKEVLMEGTIFFSHRTLLAIFLR
jgi:serine/threonine-protein phosphatase PP1-1